VCEIEFQAHIQLFGSIFLLARTIKGKKDTRNLGIIFALQLTIVPCLTFCCCLQRKHIGKNVHFEKLLFEFANENKNSHCS
jgi:hypothetical protein